LAFNKLKDIECRQWGASNCIRLRLGGDVQRDLAITVYRQISAIRGGIARNDPLSIASPLFRRHAFERVEEANWAEALYVYTVTTSAWNEVASG
jgi:hypothetical protein